MTEKNYKITIGLLLVTIVTCLIAVSILYVEIDFLKKQLCQMTNIVQTLEGKIELMIQEEAEKTYLDGKEIEEMRRYIVGHHLLMVMVNLSRILYDTLILID